MVHYANFTHKSWCKTGKTLWNSEALAKPFFITKISVERYRITNHMPGCTKPGSECGMWRKGGINRPGFYYDASESWCFSTYAASH